MACGQGRTEQKRKIVNRGTGILFALHRIFISPQNTFWGNKWPPSKMVKSVPPLVSGKKYGPLLTSTPLVILVYILDAALIVPAFCLGPISNGLTV